MTRLRRNVERCSTWWNPVIWRGHLPDRKWKLLMRAAVFKHNMLTLRFTTYVINAAPHTDRLELVSVKIVLWVELSCVEPEGYQPTLLNGWISLVTVQFQLVLLHVHGKKLTDDLHSCAGSAGSHLASLCGSNAQIRKDLGVAEKV